MMGKFNFFYIETMSNKNRTYKDVFSFFECQLCHINNITYILTRAGNSVTLNIKYYE